ncbi:MAG: hypothetical protein ABH842_00995 [Candidatus Micrarchaeota archaeon]
MTERMVEPERDQTQTSRRLSVANDFVRLAINMIPELNKTGKVSADDINCVTLFQYVARHMEVTAFYHMRRLAGQPTETLSDIAGVSRTTKFDLDDANLRTGDRKFYIFRGNDLDGIKKAVETHGSGLVIFFGQRFGPEDARERAESEISIVDGDKTYVAAHVAFAMSPEYLHLILEDEHCRVNFQEGSSTSQKIGYKPASEGGFALIQAHTGDSAATIDDLDYYTSRTFGRSALIFIPSEELVSENQTVLAQR